MARMSNSFRFIGDVVSKKDKGIHSLVKSSKEGSKWEGHKLEFGIGNEQKKSTWVELLGGNHHTIYSFNINKEKVEIPFENRLDKEVVESIAGWKKLRVVNGDDVKEFIAEWDFVLALKDTIESLAEGERLEVSGSVQIDFHKGKTYKKYIPNFVRVIKDKDVKSKFSVDLELYYTADAVDNAMDDEDRKIFINSYIKGYNSKDKTNYMIPNNVVINCSPLNNSDISDEKKAIFKKKANWMAKQFEVTEGWYKLGWETTLFKGSEGASFTEDDLTDFQKEQIDFGMQTFEDIAKQFSIRGADKVEQRLQRVAKLFSEEGREEIEEESVKFYTDGSNTETPTTTSVKQEAVISDADIDGMFE